MRIVSFVLGILGGLTGIAIHAIVAFRFFAQSDRPTEILVQIVLAGILGLAAVVISTVARASIMTLAVFLPWIGILGFFPRPTSWAPAGATLIVAGLVALVSLRRQSSRRQPAASYSATSPDRASLHWSEAARLGLNPAATTPPRRAESWTTVRKGWAVSAIVLALAVVIPLSFWFPKDVAASGQSAGETTTTTALLSEASTTSTTVDPVATTTTTTVAAPESDAFLVYDNSEHGFTIPYPVSWRYAEYEDLAVRVAGWYERLYAQEFVTATFADRNGPTHDGCYLNFMWVEVYDDETFDDSTHAELQGLFEEHLDYLRSYYHVKSIEPLREVQMGIASGQTRVWSVSPIGNHALVVRDCLLWANGNAYYLIFGAVQEEWETYDSLFEQMLHGFSIAALSPVA